jgi:ferredoxin, 2Fe-2S
MPKITYVEASGIEHTVEIQSGESVMEGAVNNGVRGIDADCGGQCAFATCDVLVDDN